MIEIALIFAFASFGVAQLLALWRVIFAPGIADRVLALDTLFINSICNMKCEHCFYWQNLNRRDDLTFDEIVRLSEDLGPVENLNLSGGEPFLRREF